MCRLKPQSQIRFTSTKPRASDLITRTAPRSPAGAALNDGFRFSGLRLFRRSFAASVFISLHFWGSRGLVSLSFDGALPRSRAFAEPLQSPSTEVEYLSNPLAACLHCSEHLSFTGFVNLMWPQTDNDGLTLRLAVMVCCLIILSLHLASVAQV